jgi:hypothetical protein
MKGWKIAAAAVLVGVVTYFGLELLLPHHVTEVKLEGLVPADSVFNGKLKAPDQLAAAEARTPAADEVEGPEAGAPSDEAARTGEATAADTPTADEPGSAPAEAPVPAGPEAEPEPPATAVETSKPAPAKPAAKSAVRPAEQKAVPPAGKPAAPAAPTAWWLGGEPGGMQIVYAGSASFERAVVLLAGTPFASADSANQTIHVSDSSGRRVAGSWTLSPKNSRMLVFPVPASGSFTITIDPGLSDAQQQQLGRPLKGTVLVR